MLSVIVDAATPEVSAMALKSKDQAVMHLIAKVRKVEAQGRSVSEVCTDNGGEFVGADYTSFCTKVGSLVARFM